MSAPIDELVIAVRIEQGTDLWAFYKMLKNLQKATGGNFKGVKAMNWWKKQMWTKYLTRFGALEKCCEALKEQGIDVEKALKEMLNNFLHDLADQIKQALSDVLYGAEFVQDISGIKMDTGNIADDIVVLKNEILDLLKNIKDDTGKTLEEILKRLKGPTLEEQMGRIQKKLERLLKNKAVFEPAMLNRLQTLEQMIGEISGTLRTELGGFHQRVKFLESLHKKGEPDDKFMTAITSFETELDEGIGNLYDKIKDNENLLGTIAEQVNEMLNRQVVKWEWLEDEVKLNIAVKQDIDFSWDLQQFRKMIEDRMFKSRVKLKEAVEKAAVKGASEVLGDLGDKLTLSAGKNMNDLYDTIEGLFDVIKHGVPEIPHPSHGQSEDLWEAMTDAEHVQEIEDLTLARKIRQTKMALTAEQGLEMIRNQEEMSEKQDDTLSKLDDIDPRSNVAEKSRDQDVQGKKENMEKG